MDYSQISSSISNASAQVVQVVHSLMSYPSVLMPRTSPGWARAVKPPLKHRSLCNYRYFQSLYWRWYALWGGNSSTRWWDLSPQKHICSCHSSPESCLGWGGGSLTAFGGRDSSGLCVPSCRRHGRSQWDKTGRTAHPGGQSEWSPPELQELPLVCCDSVAFVLKSRQNPRFFCEKHWYVFLNKCKYPKMEDRYCEKCWESDNLPLPVSHTLISPLRTSWMPPLKNQ